MMQRINHNFEIWKLMRKLEPSKENNNEKIKINAGFCFVFEDAEEKISL